MLPKLTKKYISNIATTPPLFDYSLAAHTSFNIGGQADAIVFPKNIGEIIEITTKISKLEIPLTILGGGSNTLVKDRGIRGVVMIMSNWKLDIKKPLKKNNYTILKVSSGVNMQAVCAFSIKHNLLGMNFAIGIPGTIGGAVVMNAGTIQGTMSDILHSITILNRNGSIEKFTEPFYDFSYRNWSQRKTNSIILECEINLMRTNSKDIRQEARCAIIKRKNTQPINTANAGCFFKNPKSSLSAGELIDKVGLKGKHIGGAIISEKHANFIINKDQATASDVLKLADLARKSVYNCFQIILEPEVHILGD